MGLGKSFLSLMVGVCVVVVIACEGGEQVAADAKKWEKMQTDVAVVRWCALLHVTRVMDWFEIFVEEGCDEEVTRTAHKP